MSEIVRKRPVVKPPPRPRTCRQFLDKWQPILRTIESYAELDYSFKLDGVTITDMTSPSALRTKLLYSRAEVEAFADAVDGDFERRVAKFMGN
jgi:hypothetical protein